jgi:NitT/TauT family transport system substrate-binding protein
MSQRLFVSTLALLLVLALAACSAAVPASAPAADTTDVAATDAAEAADASAADTADLVTVRIGTQPWIGYGPWWIAQEQGLFAKHGIDAQLIDFVQDTEVNAAFAAGEMDVANLASHTAIKLFANGVDLRIVLLEDASREADAIIAGAGISEIADLQGQTVAYEEGATSDLLLNYALQQNGLTLADITPAPMPAAGAGSALIAGQVAAAVTYEPYISAAMAQDPAVQVIYTGAADPGLISDVLAARAGFAQENPETMRALLQVWDEAVQFLNSNPDEGRAIIAAAVQSSAEELTTAFDGVEFYTLEQNLTGADNGSTLGVLQDVLTVSQSIGLVEQAPDLASIFDPSYLSE